MSINGNNILKLKDFWELDYSYRSAIIEIMKDFLRSDIVDEKDQAKVIKWLAKIEVETEKRKKGNFWE